MTTLKYLSLFLILTFATSFMAIGHGVAPIGLLMFWMMEGLFSGMLGNPSPVLMIAVGVSWMGLLALVIGCFLSESGSRRFIVFGAILCGLAWLGFLSQSEMAVTTFLFSMHFLAVSILLFRDALRSLPENT